MQIRFSVNCYVMLCYTMGDGAGGRFISSPNNLVDKFYITPIARAPRPIPTRNPPPKECLLRSTVWFSPFSPSSIYHSRKKCHRHFSILSPTFPDFFRRFPTSWWPFWELSLISIFFQNIFASILCLFFNKTELYFSRWLLFCNKNWCIHIYRIGMGA